MESLFMLASSHTDWMIIVTSSIIFHEDFMGYCCISLLSNLDRMGQLQILSLSHPDRIEYCCFQVHIQSGPVA